MTALVVRGDARCLPLPDRSVDLVVTSPPYWAQRSYTDGGEHYEGQIGDEATPAEYVEALVGCTREWLRVLKPSGSLFVNLGDKYAERGGPGQRGPAEGDQDSPYYRKAKRPPRRSTPGVRPKSLHGLPWRYALRCVDDLGLILRAELIWAKPNGMPESVTDRVRRSHEHWFHLTASGRYFADLDAIRVPHAPSSVARAAPHRSPSGRRDERVYGDGNAQTLDLAQSLHSRGALPGSVWSIATQPLHVPEVLGVDHYAAFPTEWPRRLILGWCPPGGVVLDPFGGTGTTALMASLLGRTGITVDRSADYCRIAQWRTAGLLGGVA